MRLNRRDSFSSDDEVPLKLISKCSNENSYKILCQPSINHCEFCDSVSNNKYDSLIHNASHIIIPLLNQKLIKCNDCLFYFTSQTEYQQHMKKHTKNLNNQHINIRNRIKFEDDSILNNSSDLLKDLNSQINIRLENLQFNNLVNNNFEIKNNSNVKNNFEIKNNSNEKNNFEIKNNLHVKNNLDVNNSVIDLDDDIPLIKNKYIFGTKTVNKIPNGRKDTEIEENGDIIYKSVHFDDLSKPKTVICRYCKQKYPNEYTLILHETCHINFNNRLPSFCSACDWYIAGDRKDVLRHKRSHSPKTRQKLNNPIEKCLQCGLSYRSYINHFKNYHNNNDETYNKVTMMCDLCYQFLKSSKLRSYEKIGTVSKVGKRFKCGHCMRKFFELNEVQKTEFIQKWCIKRSMRKMTNDQRLKKIQFRLKKINNLNKF